MVKRESESEIGTHDEDAQWIERILAKPTSKESEEAYRRLLNKHWNVVTFLIASRVGSAWEAEDLAQDAFLRAFRALPRLKEPTAFLGWLLRIAHNLVTDHLRTRKSAVSLELVPEPASDSGAGSADTDFRENLEVTEEFNAILRFVRNLPNKYREVVVLRYVENMDNKTIARHLEEPEGTIRNRLHRAVKALRSELQLRRTSQ